MSPADPKSKRTPASGEPTPEVRETIMEVPPPVASGAARAAPPRDPRDFARALGSLDPALGDALEALRDGGIRMEAAEDASNLHVSCRRCPVRLVFVMPKLSKQATTEQLGAAALAFGRSVVEHLGKHVASHNEQAGRS